MYIKSISFAKESSDGISWEIDDCYFNKINLIAGKNASGKTRTLSALTMLIKLILGDDITENNYRWKLILINENRRFIYKLKIGNSQILAESLYINDEKYFSRDENGQGTIKYETKDIFKLDFEVDIKEILLGNKRDKKQHPSLEPIFNWANSIYQFKFGDDLGRKTLYNANRNLYENQKSSSDKAVVYKFDNGLKSFSDDFKNKIIQSFNALGYNIEDILLVEISSNNFILAIKENGMQLEQGYLSQGMFRALSLIIQVTYLEFQSDNNITILIDDIGEGLDFERANNLIKYLIQKAEKEQDKMQLIMTTNDRMVMNNVPLEYWIIVDKDDNGKINFYSEKSHLKIFKKFKRIGLTNFDFFSSEYYKEN